MKMLTSLVTLVSKILRINPPEKVLSCAIAFVCLIR